MRSLAGIGNWELARRFMRGRKRDVLSERRMREIRLSASMSRMWKRTYGQTTWAPPDEKGRQPTSRTYRYLATSRPALIGLNPLGLRFPASIIDKAMNAS